MGHQDDTSAIELLGDKETEKETSDFISDVMNRSFPPKNIFVIEGVKREVEIKQVAMIKQS